MFTLKNTFIFHLLLFSFIVCCKAPKQVLEENPIELINKVIYLNKDLKITRIETFENDSLVKQEDFEYHNKFIVIREISEHSCLEVRKMFLNPKLRADSMKWRNCETPNNSEINEFIYDKNGYLILSTGFDTDSISETSKSINFVAKGNIFCSYLISGIGSVLLKQEYEFYDIENKLDLHPIKQFTGRKNTNLIKSEKSSIGEIGVLINYEYKIDSNGFLSEEQQISTSTYSKLRQSLKPKKTVIKYLYKFQ